MAKHSSGGMTPSHPIRVDYVLMTANRNEHQEAKKVFVLPEHADEDGLSYDWGRIDRSAAGSTTVALVSLSDKPGRTSAAAMTGRVLSILAPTYILILGTAGGVSRLGAPLRTGDVIIPRVIHTGTLKDTALRNSPIQQPSAGLYATAWRITTEDAEKWHSYIRGRMTPASPITRARSWGEKWRRCIRGRMTRDPLDDYKPTAQPDSESVSTDVLIPGINSLLKQLLQDFPKMTAVEMEAGGVAHELHEASGRLGTTYIAEYLVIKGISDILYNEKDHVSTDSEARARLDSLLVGRHVTESVKKGLIRTFAVAMAEPPTGDAGTPNQDERDRWSPFASLASAAFAKRLVEAHSPHRRLPTPYIRIWRTETRNWLHTFDGSVRTLVDVNPEQYSNLAAEVLDRLTMHFDSRLHFFTVCAFSPSRLYELLLARYKADVGSSADPGVPRLTTWAKNHLTHFRRFAEHAKKHKDQCARVLIVDNLETWPGELVDPAHWQFFSDLNDGVPCWAIDRPNVKRIGFLTDYVILGEEVLLDWYEDAHLLNVGDVSHIAGSTYFLALFTHFKENRDRFPYRRIDTLDPNTVKQVSLGTGP